MIYPVNNIAITQGHHDGLAIDFGWCSHHNQDILSVDDGVVYKVEYQQGGGNVVTIKHNTGIFSVYAHLKDVFVKKGQKVKLGQKIATMGKSGKYATAEHLHFQLAKKGSKSIYSANLDPFKFLQVFPNQKVAKSGNTLKFKKKIMYAPENRDFTAPATYRLMVKKAVRKSPTLINNIITYCDVGTDIKAKNIVEKSNRIWGQTTKGYLVLENNDGTDQAFKL